MAKDDQIAQEYSKSVEALQRCRAEAREILVTLLGAIGSSHLVRAQIHEPRVKALSSALRKAKARGLSAGASFWEINDLVGFRIVCNNLEDVYRINDAILASPRFEHDGEEVKDYIQRPQASGYRAVHINLAFNVMTTQPTRVPCEIQIRTLAQDSWARLSHHDLYKEGGELPEHLHKSAARLASLLAVADEIAQDLREQASAQVPAVAPPDSNITPEALSFVYERMSGSAAPDYLTKYVLDRCNEVGLQRLDLLDRTLEDKDARERIAGAYEESARWSLSDETWFELAVDLAARGMEFALDQASARGQEERAEIEAIARRDLETDLPDSFEEFPDAFFSHSMKAFDTEHIYQVAEMWDAVKFCVICGAPIVESDKFVEEALDYYEIDADQDGDLGAWLAGTGVELGDWDNSDLCSYHGWVMSKDD